MQMLFTWSTENLCIVFSGWRVTSFLSLILSLLAVVALTAGYEAVRELSRQYEVRLEEKLKGTPSKFLLQPICIPETPSRSPLWEKRKPVRLLTVAGVAPKMRKMANIAHCYGAV
jgi:hypothetical protein